MTIMAVCPKCACHFGIEKPEIEVENTDHLVLRTTGDLVCISLVEQKPAESPKPGCLWCGNVDTEYHYSGERGEIGPFLYCHACGFDEEQDAKP